MSIAAVRIITPLLLINHCIIVSHDKFCKYKEATYKKTLIKYFNQYKVNAKLIQRSLKNWQFNEF